MHPAHKEGEIGCPECAAFAATGFGAPAVDFRDSPGVWWAYNERDRRPRTRASVLQEFGLSPSTAALESLQRLLSGLVPPHRRGPMPDRLTLFMFYSWVLCWLDHYHRAAHEDPAHLLRVGAPEWMRGLARRAAGQLRVSAPRWSIVRQKAARLVVANVLRVKGGDRVVHQKLQRGPALELVDHRGLVAIHGPMTDTQLVDLARAHRSQR
ncbi:MAG: hypothetical protein E6J45_14245 [Chloroflexi bacterium]|nr:MAG: hypothetical protein E6J45_14245 [Chloroflexota bacterium]